MRGFIITLISISLVTLLVTFSSVLYNGHLEMERALYGPRPLIYAGFMFDSVSGGLNDIIGPKMEFFEKNDSYGILIQDSLPGENHSQELSDYEDFLESTLANSSNVLIGVNLTNISQEVTIGEKYLYDNNETMTFTADSGTGAVSYEINITVFEDRLNISTFDFNSTGDLNITINYADMNGTISESGQVYSDSINLFSANYSSGNKLEIELGRNMGNDGSLEIDTNGASANVSFFVLLPPLQASDWSGYMYNTTMQYRQGKIYMGRNLGK